MRLFLLSLLGVVSISAGLLDGLVGGVVKLPETLIGLTSGTVNQLLDDSSNEKDLREAFDKQGQALLSLAMGTLILSDISKEDVKNRLNKWLSAAPDDFREQALAYADKELKSLVFLKERLAKEPPKVQDAVKQLILLKTKKTFLGSSSDTRKVHFQAIMKELNEDEATSVRKILEEYGSHKKKLGLAAISSESKGLLGGILSLPFTVVGLATDTLKSLLNDVDQVTSVRKSFEKQGQGLVGVSMANQLISPASDAEVKANILSFLEGAPDDFKVGVLALVERQLKYVNWIKDRIKDEPPKVQEAVKQMLLLKNKRDFLSLSADGKKAALLGITKDLSNEEVLTVDKILDDIKNNRKVNGI